MIIVTVKSEQTFQLDADAFLVGGRYSLRADRFSMEEIHHFRTLTKKELYLNVEKILHESELVSFEEYICSLKDSLDGFYYSDHAVFMIAKKHGFLNKLIYNPGTLVASKQDAAFYLSLGIKRVCLAREITLENILDIKELIDVEVIIHGYLNMFYSKRNLLTNYFTYLEQEPVKKGFLEEEKRSEHYPIVEDDTGSHVFHGNVLASFEEYPKFKQLACRIDGYLMNEEEIAQALSFYRKLDQGAFPEEVMHQFDTLYGPDKRESGFYYKKTVYKK